MKAIPRTATSTSRLPTWRAELRAALLWYRTFQCPLRSDFAAHTDRPELADCTHRASDPRAALRSSASAEQSNNQTPINNEGVCHGIHSTQRTLEQRQAGWPEAASEAQGHLGDPDTPPEQAPRSRPRPVQFGD